MEMNEPRGSREQQSDGDGAAVDAPDGERHRRTVPVPRRPLNLSERHFSSITRNPTHAHSQLRDRRGQLRSTTSGSSGSRVRGEKLIRIRASEASRVRH